MENEVTYKVLMGDPFGGHITVEKGLTLDAAEKLELTLQEECDYFTIVFIKPDNDTE